MATTRGLLLSLSLSLSLAMASSGCGDDSHGAPDLAVADLGAAGDLAVPDLATTATAARGEELVKHLLFCGSCHTTPDATGAPSTAPSDFLAGGRKFVVARDDDGGTATVYAPNLTPDTTTGVGSWTASQIADAVTVGVDKDGLPLWPTMPYPRFANLTPDDAASIALYLQSLPAQSHVVPEDSAHPSLAAPAQDLTAIPHTTLAPSDPQYAAAERGRYLANLGCLHCHTPDGPPPLGLDAARAYAGGRLLANGPRSIPSANLTPDATGLAGWTLTELIATLKSDLEKGTGAKLCPPMPGGPSGFGGLLDGDLRDLAAFVQTLPKVVNGPFDCPDGGS